MSGGAADVASRSRGLGLRVCQDLQERSILSNFAVA